MSKKLRVGVVPYMNAKPLIYGLGQGNGAVELVFEVPALLPGMLDSGHIDVSLIPSIEYFRNGNFAMIPDISISSIGEVESVKLFSKVPVQDVRSAALDKSSLTSCALTRILLKERYRLSPRYSSWNSQGDVSTSGADAVLIIGDNAMKVVENGYFTLDLGKAWYEFTGLPFVFAVWAVKKDRHIAGINKMLKDAKDAGMRSVAALAEAESKRLQFPVERCRNYLTNSIRYNLGKDEIQGLRAFYQQAVKLGLAPDGVEIVFHGIQ